MEGREREGPKLLLNQGPSEPCYATDVQKQSQNKHFAHNINNEKALRGDANTASACWL